MLRRKPAKKRGLAMEPNGAIRAGRAIWLMQGQAALLLPLLSKRR